MLGFILGKHYLFDFCIKREQKDELRVSSMDKNIGRYVVCNYHSSTDNTGCSLEDF